MEENIQSLLSPTFSTYMVGIDHDHIRKHRIVA